MPTHITKLLFIAAVAAWGNANASYAQEQIFVGQEPRLAPDFRTVVAGTCGGHEASLEIREFNRHSDGYVKLTLDGQTSELSRREPIVQSLVTPAGPNRVSVVCETNEVRFDITTILDSTTDLKSPEVAYAIISVDYQGGTTFDGPMSRELSTLLGRYRR